MSQVKIRLRAPELPDKGTAAPTHVPAAPSLQFIAIGQGGRVSNLRKVRSHVSKEYHLKKRAWKKVCQDQLEVQKNLQLQPSQGDLKAPVGIFEGGNLGDGIAGNHHAKKENGEREWNASKILSQAVKLSPCVFVHNGANLVPYAWFEKDGPVLYVDRTKWPFPVPLNVTGSDRSDLSFKNLIPRRSHWMPQKRTSDFVVVRGAVLDSAVVQWISETPECFQFRVETIKWIREQLEDPVTLTSNATIGAIMTFTMWTAGNGNQVELSAHMNAVERIVCLKGGFETLKSDKGADGAMLAKVTIFDSIMAVLTGLPPRFPLINYFVSKPMPDFFLLKHESPLYGLGDFDNLIGHHKDQQSIIALLLKARKLTQSFESRHTSTIFEPTPTWDVIPFIKEQTEIFKKPLLTLPIVSSCYDPTHSHVLEALTSASIIYSRSLACPVIDFPSPKNDVPFKELCKAFGKSSEDEFWVSCPGILLWLLLVGASASRGKKESAFWTFYLGRVTVFSSAESRLVGTAAIRKFLEIQSWMKEAICTK